VKPGPRQAVQSRGDVCFNHSRVGQLVPLLSIKRADACTDRYAKFLAATGGAARPFGMQSLHQKRKWRRASSRAHARYSESETRASSHARKVSVSTANENI
jgi:hypothetical protein